MFSSMFEVATPATVKDDGSVFMAFLPAIIEWAFLLMCLIVWLAYCKGRLRADRTVAKEEFTGDMAPTTLCGCWEMGCKAIVEGFFCCVCVHAENVEKSLPPQQRCGMCGQIVLIFCSIGCAPWCWWYWLKTGVEMRMKNQKLPMGVKTQPDCCMECLKSFCCSWCSTMQIAEFTDLYDTAYGKTPDEGTTLLDGKI